ncbi:P-loop containing nucleoside triphosphate hydrolase protein [Amylocarpus encephaloides]|uniref:DNA 3'-5' helicase n=1 Tax=Amylocarpus encephaloides TaxID=45428 RepID=A0A9P8C241_9HELO|nr:P-loop containing nucleoside triphosphate hydrolase protein [Amylocarpus encephaloides]
MPPKRKASSYVRGGAKVGRASAASTPGPNTPRSLASSSDEYSSASESEKERVVKTVSKFSVDSLAKPRQHIGKDSASYLFKNKDFSAMLLKPDHENRPLWIDPFKARIILESFSPLAAHAQDFLTTVAEPQSRPKFLHEYSLTPHSLYAAVSVGLDPNDIINVLDRLSKSPVPEELKKWILTCTKSYGKVKMVLKHNKHFVESTDPEILQMLLKDSVIGPLRVQGTTDITTTTAPKMQGLVIPGTKNFAGVQQATGLRDKVQPKDDAAAQDDIVATLNEDDDEDEEAEAVHSFEIADDTVEIVQKRCLELELPILQEYDFRNDLVNPNLDIDLKPAAQIRSYQEKSLSKMFGNGRAKSGMIVLPCGAGKTLVGITAACTIKKGVIILCTSSMSVRQWRQEFLNWSNINPNDICVFTSDNKETFTGNTGVIVTSYSMVAQKGKRSHQSQKTMDFITGREWGLMILDEVHVAPANVFRRVTSTIKTHAKLGLTATLLREDDKITDLNFLIGPKLYEANWMELSEQGHIARVQCAEVWCPMTTEFYSEYLNLPSKKKALMWTMNPRKFQAAQYLINYHEKQGDKIIVFADNIFALKAYATKLQKAFIYGDTNNAERERILDNFRHNPDINTLFLSKIGDTSLDLPEATVLIQISSHYGSRRQEAQRLGRILRAKRRNEEGFNAYFYSLVSKDTQEMFYSSKRQAFLVDQGYAFKVITKFDYQGQNINDLAFSTPAERRELLQNILLANDDELDADDRGDDMYHARDGRAQANKKKKTMARRTAGALSELAGGQDMAYVEQNRSRNKDLKKKGPSNPFFKKMQRETEKRRKAMEDSE